VEVDQPSAAVEADRRLIGGAVPATKVSQALVEFSEQLREWGVGGCEVL
jgi:hypothetical protein